MEVGGGWVSTLASPSSLLGALRSRKSSDGPDLHPALLQRGLSPASTPILSKELTLFEKIKKEKAMELGTPSQTEIKLGLIEARHGAKMNSAHPCIDPLLGGQDPEPVILPHGSHMCPQAGYLPAAHTPPASLPPQEAGAGSASILGLQVSVTLSPRPKLSLRLEIQAEL